MTLTRLTYHSQSNHFLTWPMVKDILFVAQENNKKRDITGLLISSDMQFLQTLEGDEQDVKEIYTKITEDPRHTNCQLLECTAIEERQFGQWSMRGFEFDQLTPDQQKSILQRYCSEKDHFYISDDAEACLGLMRDLNFIH